MGQLANAYWADVTLTRPTANSDLLNKWAQTRDRIAELEDECERLRELTTAGGKAIDALEDIGQQAADRMREAEATRRCAAGRAGASREE